MSKRNKPKGKKINPTYWIFCEGKTEEAYVSYLRSAYRLPIEIIPRIAGSSINENFIQKSRQGKPTHPKDKIFLIYDGDVSATVKQLQSIASASAIISNPCIELWFLYHFKDHKSFLSNSECIKALSKVTQNQYKKGFLNNNLTESLIKYCANACKRAKASQYCENPSSNFHLLIEELERMKK